MPHSSSSHELHCSYTLMLIPSPQDVPIHLVFSTALSLRNKGEELMICWRNLKGRVIINHLNHHKPIYFPSYSWSGTTFLATWVVSLDCDIVNNFSMVCFKISLPCYQSLLSREVKRPFAWKSAIKDSLFPKIFCFWHRWSLAIALTASCVRFESCE